MRVEDKTQPAEEEIFRISGYVCERILDERIEVMVNEDGNWKKLLMPIDLFKEQGILGEDMRFIYRIYRKDGQVYSEILSDDSQIEEMPPIPQSTLEMLAKLKIREEEARRNLK